MDRRSKAIRQLLEEPYNVINAVTEAHENVELTHTSTCEVSSNSPYRPRCTCQLVTGRFMSSNTGIIEPLSVCLGELVD